MSKYRYSIIVATRNCLSYLMRTLDSINKADFSGPTELIVVDDASTDATPKFLERFKSSITNPDIDFKMLRNPTRLGAIKSRNKALELASGDFILQIDSDVLLEKNWEQGALKYFSDEVIAVGPTGSYCFPDFSNFNKDGDKARPGDYVDALMGYCWLWRNLYPELRYREDFGIIFHEEMDYQLILKERGWRIRKCDLIAEHLGQASEHKFDQAVWDQEQKNRKITGERFRKLVEEGKIKLEEIPQ